MRLSRRLLLLMFAAMFPVVAVLFYNLWALQSAREKEIHDRVFQTGQLTALEIQRILSGMESILYTVSSAASVQEFNADRCAAFLSNTVVNIPAVQSIGVIGLDGLVKCRQDSQGLGLSLADRPFFQDALRTGGFVVGGFTKSRITGRALLPMAIPLKDRSRQVIGVVALSLDLDWLQEVLTSRKFDPGAALTVADRDGVILARFPSPERFVGTKIPEQYQYLVKAAGPGTIELTSQDGTRRLQAYFPPGASSRTLYVSQGLSVDNSFYAIKQATIYSILATVVAIGGSLLLAWQTNRHAIQKPVSRILNALTAWREGNNDIRTRMPVNGDELSTIGAAVDGFMDELLAAKDQRDLLEAEMAHRIKNLLAIVQSIAQQTFRGNSAAAEELRTYSQRLAAIGEAFTLLGKEGQSAKMRALVETTVTPFRHPDHPHFDISGPDLEISAKSALAIAMAIHELATNAVKYGALGNEDGRVLVKWETDGDDFVFQWQERDGPPVIPPEKSGFGSRMMERALTGQTGGKVSMEYASDGLKYSLRAPLSGLRATH